jgi:hypothetical protein
MAFAMSRSDANPSRIADPNATPYWQPQPSDSGQPGGAKDEQPPTFSTKIRADMISKINEIQSWFVGRHPAQ